MKVLLLFITMFYSIEGTCAESDYDVYPEWMKTAFEIGKNSNYDKSKKENRVMFDEDIGWALNKRNTDQVVSRLHDAGFNVYIPCVWHGKGTYYPTRIAHQDKRIKQRILIGEDPLEYLISKAREKNIEVHPWFTVVRREDDYNSEFFDLGSPPKAYNVHDERFRKFIVSLMLEVVSKYDVDGINLDYIRSMGYCRSQECAEQYNKTYSRSLFTDLILERVPKSRIDSIAKWNESAIEDIVKTFSLHARKIDPQLYISVDSVPNARHLRMQGQDSLKWLNEGWIDGVFFMLYRDNFDLDYVQRIREKVRSKDSIIPLMALYNLKTLEKKPPSYVVNIIEAARMLWPNSGLAFYHYKQLGDGQAKAMSSSVYKNKVASQLTLNR